jgi:hypothetical protein
MIPMEKGIYCERSRAGVRYIKGWIAMVTLESKGHEIELILNILYSNILTTKVYIVSSRELLLTDCS